MRARFEKEEEFKPEVIGPVLISWDLLKHRTMALQMLTVGGDVLIFQRKTVSSRSRDQRQGSEVTFCSLTFNPDGQSFLRKDPTMYSLHRDGSAEANVLHCSAALDVRQRRKVTCVLLGLCRKRTSAFKYLLYSVNSPSDAELHLEFVLPYEMTENISILQGPTLMWCHENTVCYVCSQAPGVQEFPVPMTVRFIGELPLRQRKIVVLGTPEKSTNESIDVAELKNTLYFIEDGRSINGDGLVPDAYSSVIQCMLVLSAEEISGSVRSAVLVATSMKQLVYFENGVPLEVCLLPYEHPQSIKTLQTVRNCLIIITFSQGNVCAVWKDTFQVCCCWTDVHLSLVDDFLGCGTDQILLMFEEPRSSGELLNNFLLTDLCGITYSCGRADSDVMSTSDTAQENYMHTVRALESRLQSGLNFLEDLQKDVDVKDRVLHQVLVALTDLISDREHVMPSLEQEGLVSLWDKDDDDDDDDDDGLHVYDERMHTECDEAPVKVLRVWQRVIRESFICGIVMTTSNIMCVKNISASVLAECPVTVKSSIHHGSTSDMTEHCYPTPVKNLRHSAENIPSTFTLLTVTDLNPLFISNTVTYPIILHYCKETSSSSSDESARVSHHCGHISVNIKDLHKGKINPQLQQDNKLVTEESREDLLGLIAVMDSRCFLINCCDHTLSDVQSWLKDELHAEHLVADPNYTTPPSARLLFHWVQKTPFQGLLTVHYRDELELLGFLNSLGDFLPVSHHVRLVRTPGSRRHSGVLSRTLETEIQSITQAVSSVLQCEETEVSRGQRSSSETLQKLRHECQTDRERYYKRLRPLVDTTRYCRLIQSLIDTQMYSDVVVLTEAQTDLSRL